MKRVLAIFAFLFCASCAGGDSASSDAVSSATTGEEVVVLEAPPGAPSEWVGPTSSGIVPDEPLCPECRIRATPLFTFGAAEGPGSLYGMGQIMADALDRFWYLENDRVPVLFGPGGEFLQELGTRGQGPGQFMTPRLVLAVPGDSVVVFDTRNARAVVIGPSLEPARYITTPFPLNGVVVLSWPDLLIAENSVVSREPEARLYEIDLSGRAATTSRIGWDAADVPSSDLPDTSYRLASSEGEGFWAIELYQYVITRWPGSSDPPRVWIREAPWFTKAALQGTPRPNFVTHTHEYAGGSLWVAINQPSEAVGEMSRTVIEVMDPTEARVFARDTLDEFVIGFLPGQRVATYVEDGAGIPRVSIMAMEIVR